MATVTDEVRASFGRAMSRSSFIARFYEIFTASHPRVAALFNRTDMKQQHEVLSQALSMVVLFPQGNPIAKSAINRIRGSHDRNHLNITPELYGFWEDSLIKALAESDPQFDAALERRWREVLAVAINYIKEGY